MMSCDEVRRLISLYVDDELPAAQVAACDAHFNGCAECRRRLESARALSSAIRSKASYAKAPAALRERIRSAVRAEAAPERERFWSRREVFGASTFLGGALAYACLSLLFWPPAAPGLGSELLESHLRSLQAGHLMDVVSTNQHTVKPWFNGRVDFSPVVRDLASDGYPLAGGRLDYVGGRAVAVLVYRRREHVINVYTWPAPASAAGETRGETKQGFREVRWTKADLTYWAVSDLNEQELSEFVRLLSRD